MKKYIICDPSGFGFYKQTRDGVSFVYNECEATYFTKEKAENTLKNNGAFLDGLGNFTHTIKEIDVCENAKMIDSIKEQSNFQKEEYDNVIMDIDNVMETISNLPSKIDNEKKRLKSRLSTISVMITDVWHYLELTSKISASKRCQISMLETSLLQERRNIKDSLYKIEKMQEMLNNNFLQPKLKALEDRSYKPRILVELFDDNKIPKNSNGWFETYIDKAREELKNEN